MTAGPVERQVSVSEAALRSAGVGAGSGRPVGGVWLRRVSALVVAAVAAYASYQHQRRFALGGGADPLGAALWPASVDGLMVLATVNLLTANVNSRRAWWAARWSFALGAVVSLAANHRRRAQAGVAADPGGRLAAAGAGAGGRAARLPA
jgi:lysylphosphatidylglycerol synthetase-like protein (DUF2156 family)